MSARNLPQDGRAGFGARRSPSHRAFCTYRSTEQGLRNRFTSKFDPSSPKRLRPAKAIGELAIQCIVCRLLNRITLTLATSSEKPIRMIEAQLSFYDALGGYIDSMLVDRDITIARDNRSCSRACGTGSPSRAY
ncbi:hypothetical protein [Mesorhizobium sophorae]|uniref:hypothetical protein n=1 Tax=Mesorhizobium sophorae TaxID=1300294 RepID=UPI00118039E0|nr:hypothetical protein [Mesorhizobium sophorae]